uniref:Uncharacterized protein n=1 Tax=mine drainage metagenome TaxID=410659 RepID=E6QB26_9ZZZZ
MHEEYPRVVVIIDLSRNFGKEAALTAGWTTPAANQIHSP